MSYPVIVSPEAEAQAEAIDEWWRANRPASPDLFAEELAAAFITIGNAPEAGHRYPHPEVKGIQRVALRATRNHVYYVTGAWEGAAALRWGSTTSAAWPG